MLARTFISVAVVAAAVAGAACATSVPPCEPMLVGTCRARCEAGSGQSCAIAASALATLDPKAATELLLRGCLSEYAPACYAAGLSFVVREKPSPALAARSFEAGCHLGHADSCAMRAAVLEDTGNMPETEAVAVYSRACLASSAVGCGFAGDHYLVGRGVAKDVESGFRLLREACEHGETTSCERAKRAPAVAPAAGPEVTDAGSAD